MSFTVVDMADTEAAGRLCGRVAPKSRPKALRLGEYLDAGSVDLPARTDRRANAGPALKRMYCNDQLSCCVISDRAHSLGLASAAAAGTPVLATDDEVRRIYSGFSPRDRGCVITEVLDYQQERGLLLGGKVRKIGGYLAFNWRNRDLFRAALYLFGTAAIGVNLPREWQRSPDGSRWDRTNSPIVGGHDIPAVDFDEDGVWISTWAGLRLITWAEIEGGEHIDECYVTLADDWFGDAGLSASGLDKATLQADLAKIGAGSIPPIATVPPALDWSGWA